MVAPGPTDPLLPWLAAPLREALRMARTHHALLIHGPAGVGQFELQCRCRRPGFAKTTRAFGRAGAARVAC